MRNLLACLLVVTASGCPDVKTDPGEGSDLPPIDGPTVEFDPLHSILPFPNNLVLDPMTGKVNIPAAACESATSAAIRTGVLNQLDGFGTFEAAMQVTFTEPVDDSTLAGNIVMYQRAHGATSDDPASAQPIPVKLIKGTTLRFTEGACTSPATIDAVTVVPMVPLSQKSTYTLAILAGVKTVDGKDFIPSATWALVRQKDDPVTLDAMGNVISENTPLDPAGDANNNGIPDLMELQGLDQLWKAHAQGLAFLDATGHSDRTKILVAWEVTTQTTTDQLDPTVTGSPAANLATTALLGTNSIVCDIDAVGSIACPHGYHREASPGSNPYAQCPGGDNGTQCFLKIALGSASCAGGCTLAQIYTTGNGICTQVGCSAISDILGAGLPIANYQVGGSNPLVGGAAVPGAWSDPINPMSQGTAILEVLIFIPTAAGPRPTVVFGHGLGSSKSALFGFAPQLANSPGHFASVAIDFVAHGSRAVQISNSAALGCAGTPPLDPTSLPQCFQPIFSADLGQTRDNIRQTVLDLQRLTLATKACGAAGCLSANPGGNGTATPTSLMVDPTHIMYAGQSLGGIIGSTAFSVAADLKRAVLDVPAVGLLEILENTTTLEIRCSLVDALIDAGILVGDKWNDSTVSPTGLCSTDAWKLQSGYAQFSGIARWVIDPSDGANYTPKLATKKFVIQEVVNDEVVPNVATDIEGALVGLMPGMADIYIPQCADNSGACQIDAQCPASVKCLADPSVAVTASPMTWVRYPTLPPNVASGFPGNTFSHASLLRPTNTNPDGLLGTARLQTDAITFLLLSN